MSAINITDLKGAAKTYDPVLRALPFFTFEEFAKALRITVLEVKTGTEETRTSLHRRAGGTFPYSAGKALPNQMSELMKAKSEILKPELVAMELQDNITNYLDKQALVIAGTPFDPKSKKHPLERQIVENAVRSHAEDVVLTASMFGERDLDVHTPAAAFDGFYTKFDIAAAEGKIDTTAGGLNKNYETSGAFGGEITALQFDAAIDWIGNAHPMLRSSRSGMPVLWLSSSLLRVLLISYKIKTKSHTDPTLAQMLDAIRDSAFCPALEFATHEALGTGSKLTLMKAGNAEMGVDTLSSKSFVQVRAPFRDPNIVQFWIEAGYGTRINDYNAKMFRTNEQSNTALDLAGDYTETSEEETGG